MDTSRYRAFIQAADSGSLSRAARALSYTPSGVSQLISALERDLGFAVLERSTQGVRTTVEGTRILPICRSVVQEEDRLMQIASEVKGLATGSVTIGSYPSVATHWLPGVIKQFRERYPAIEIRIMEGIHQEVTAWLGSLEADLGFISHEALLPTIGSRSPPTRWWRSFPPTTRSPTPSAIRSPAAMRRTSSCPVRAKTSTRSACSRAMG